MKKQQSKVLILNESEWRGNIIDINKPQSCHKTDVFIKWHSSKMETLDLDENHPEEATTTRFSPS